MNEAVERRPYPLDFVGERSVTTQLSWGQQWVWDALSNLPDGRHMCIDIVQPIAGEIGMRPEHAARAVGALVNRFEALRTVFVEDGEAPMGLRQKVLTSGTLPVEVWTVSRFDQTAAALVAAEMSQLDFAVRDLPFRAVILAEEGAARLVSLRMSHIVADMWSAALLRTELRYELGLTNPGEPIRRGSRDWQPVDQAEFEAGEMGRRVCDRSLQYWRKQMHRFPATLFSRPSAPPDTPRYCEGRVSSRASFAAIHLLSRRYGRCSPPIVLMAAVIALIGAWSGTASVGLPVIVSNRHARRLQGLVGPLVEMGAVCVDVAGRRFENIVRSTAQASLIAQRHGLYDIPRYRDLQAEVARERGGRFEMSSYLNVRAWGDKPAVPQADGRAHRAILDLTEETSVTWNEGFESYNVKLGVLADLGSGVARLTLRADTSAIPRRDVSALLDSLDPLLIAALREEGLGQAGVERIVARSRCR
ncbi:condensation domain-containing protein [Micromonospora sp. ATCC 39149]|uniref:Condensation domain-containing protein n=1 Tax=Micromonospora carbonacea TaxID=47853 RepID=A0A7D6CEV6_9ACTN|nr:condensation domain-containing protein [Micromonospora sp. ATCC 39149]QLJ97708.1 hypothetical protein HZU44_23495 [Micromonospora carbonacea]